MSEPTREEIAWAAGLFEGEGCVVPMGKTAAKIGIEMTDLDVLETFQRVVGAGAMHEIKHRRGHKQSWSLQIYKADDVRRILRWFLPYLHSRRREKAEEMLLRLSDNPGPHSEKTHCANGHELNEGNIYRAPGTPSWRKCRACHREKAKARRLKEATA